MESDRAQDDLVQPGPDPTYPAEWHLLERIAVLDEREPAALDEIRELMSQPLDVNRLVALAMRQHLLPALADAMVCAEYEKLLPSAMRQHVLSVLSLSRHRVALLTAEALRVTEALTGCGVRVACTKGTIFQQTLYNGRGSRHMADIDLMILPESQRTVTKVLADLGLAPAKWFDSRGGGLVDVPRDILAVYRLYPDHLPHFSRLTGEYAVPAVSIDVAFNLTWFGSRWEIPIDDALAEVDQVAVAAGPVVGNLPTLTAPYTFLFLVFHLFREAWYERFATQNDVRLTQFADVVRFWRQVSPGTADRIRELLAQHDLGLPACWVAHHVDALFGTRLVAELGLTGVGTQEWFRSGGGPGTTELRWDGDMRRRLIGSTALAFVPVGGDR